MRKLYLISQVADLHLIILAYEYLIDTIWHSSAKFMN